jgi:cell division protein FtsW (lipid II flippase)
MKEKDSGQTLLTFWLPLLSLIIAGYIWRWIGGGWGFVVALLLLGPVRGILLLISAAIYISLDRDQPEGESKSDPPTEPD